MSYLRGGAVQPSLTNAESGTDTQACRSRRSGSQALSVCGQCCPGQGSCSLGGRGHPVAPRFLLMPFPVYAVTNDFPGPGADTHPRQSLLGPGPTGQRGYVGQVLRAPGQEAGVRAEDDPGGASVSLLSSPPVTVRGHQLVLGWRQARKTFPLNKRPGPCPLPDLYSDTPHSGHGAGSLATNEPRKPCQDILHDSTHTRWQRPGRLQRWWGCLSQRAPSRPLREASRHRKRRRWTQQEKGAGRPPGTDLWEAAPGRRTGWGRGPSGTLTTLGWF